ncbi:MAG: aminomethyl-transferring glycine dehydrogenase subunit GcvPB, partial [Acidiferrobacterales bacterium]
MLIFELSQPDRRNASQISRERANVSAIPEQFRRKRRPRLPQVSELQAVRHYTSLSQKNFSIDTQF